jgi:hypothetical protein
MAGVGSIDVEAHSYPASLLAGTGPPPDTPAWVRAPSLGRAVMASAALIGAALIGAAARF